jgi:hypothetical protein
MGWAGKMGVEKWRVRLFQNLGKFRAMYGQGVFRILILPVKKV